MLCIWPGPGRMALSLCFGYAFDSHTVVGPAYLSCVVNYDAMYDIRATLESSCTAQMGHRVL